MNKVLLTVLLFLISVSASYAAQTDLNLLIIYKNLDENNVVTSVLVEMEFKRGAFKQNHRTNLDPSALSDLKTAIENWAAIKLKLFNTEADAYEATLVKLKVQAVDISTVPIDKTAIDTKSKNLTASVIIEP